MNSSPQTSDPMGLLESNQEGTKQEGSRPNDRSLRTFAFLAVLSTCLYGAIAWLSWQFDYYSVTTNRPIIAVLLLFTTAFAAYLLAVRLAWRATQSPYLLGLIVGGAVVFRGVLLFSVPIQEIDIYRYLWDGAVCSVGVSPFRYTPEQVRRADANTLADDDLRRLVELRDHQPDLAEVLDRVHFGELPTIYPPTSQVVFVAAAVTTPSAASLMVRVFIMKAWLIVFDLATLGVVIALLKLCHKPVAMCVIYAWCPLLLKEVANSGHLDAVAFFLTSLAVYLVASLLAKPTTQQSWLSPTLHTTLIGLVLALAVGAKLYPIVLAPIIFLAIVKKIGWRWVPVPAATFAVTTLLVLWPMLPRETAAIAESPEALLSGATEQQTQTIDPSQGVATFLRHFEMNDFIFLLVIENLKPSADLEPQKIAWFSILPEFIRQDVVVKVAGTFDVLPREVPFLLTRVLTGFVFVVLAFLLAHRAARSGDTQQLCETSFLTLAWFWLLCPTQNPWYWTWALPLLPFARGRAWLAVSGLALLYYLRFWLSYHWTDAPVLGTSYIGTTFFDFVVTWLEFAPWFTWLAVAAAMRAIRSRGRL